MISTTHLVFGISLAYILEKRLVTASVFSIVPDFDITFSFLYPFQHRGIMHSFLAAGIFSVLVYAYSEDRVSAESCFLGYSSALLLDTLTSSGVPLFFPWNHSFSLSLVSAYSLPGNLAVIVISLAGMLVKKHWSIFRPMFETVYARRG